MNVQFHLINASEKKEIKGFTLKFRENDDGRMVIPITLV